tara:strand:- start:153 stop:842 length:690 start_codon:yes stop_codon:yes gene_type:complete
MSIADRIFEDGMLEDENSRNDLNYGDRFYRGEEVEYCYNKTEDKFETINEKNEKMGKMKEEYMQMQEEMQYNLEPKESINQINNKVKKVNNVEEATMVKETKEETLKRLFLANGLVKEDVHKDPRGFVIIKRSGIDKIVSRQNIQVAYEPVTMTPEWVVLRATASMRTGTGEHDVRNMMSFGEASDSNLMGGAKKFPVAMAEKRAMSRVVLKIAGFYEQGVFGQDEMAD